MSDTLPPHACCDLYSPKATEFARALMQSFDRLASKLDYADVTGTLSYYREFKKRADMRATMGVRQEHWHADVTVGSHGHFAIASIEKLYEAILQDWSDEQEVALHALLIAVTELSSLGYIPASYKLQAE